MSSSTPSIPDHGGTAENQARPGLLEPVRGVAFWAAIALPFLQIPVLVSPQLDQGTTLTAFVALLVLNVLALYVGHTYRRAD